MSNYPHGWLRRYRDAFSGQALVEFALVIPVFLFMLFGVVDMARFVFMNSSLSQAAREGARLGAVEAYWVGHTTATDQACNAAGGPVCRANLAQLRADILAAANGLMVGTGTITDANLHVTCEDPAPVGAWTSPTHSCTFPQDVGGPLSVRVVLDYHPITPIIGQMFPSITSAASATMVIN